MVKLGGDKGGCTFNRNSQIMNTNSAHVCFHALMHRTPKPTSHISLGNTTVKEEVMHLAASQGM